MNEDVAVALSDLLVLTASQRAYARVRSSLKAIPPSERHRGYEYVAIPESQIERALADAWTLCPMLASRNRLDIDAAAWAERLDGYTRALFLMGEPHSIDRVRAAVVAPLYVAEERETPNQLRAV